MNHLIWIFGLSVLLLATASAQERQSTRVGTFVDYPAFPSVTLQNTRPISVLLPPSYATEKTRRYPVLYMHDGQNVFDEKTSFIGKEWRVDEVLRDMWADKSFPEIIVVGVANTGIHRMFEYRPGAGGDRYIRFLTNEVKPFIDLRFRTKKGPKDTAVMGSSMGGLISTWATLRRPDVFGQSASVSMLWRFHGEAIVDRVERGPKQPVRMYFDMGTREFGVPEAELTAGMNDMRTILAKAGYVEGKDVETRIIEGGEHNEPSWAARVDQPLRFLFPK